MELSPCVSQIYNCKIKYIVPHRFQITRNTLRKNCTSQALRNSNILPRQSPLPRQRFFLSLLNKFNNTERRITSRYANIARHGRSTNHSLRAHLLDDTFVCLIEFFRRKLPASVDLFACDATSGPPRATQIYGIPFSIGIYV